jgi:hypothetical protein
MLGVDTYWLVSEVLLIVTFLAFLITQVLMPGRKKIESGVKKIPEWIGFALIIMLIFTIAVGIVAFLVVEKYHVILISGGVLGLALVIALIDFYRIKSYISRLSKDGVHHAVEVTPEGLTHHDHAHFHHPYHNHQHMATPTNQPQQPKPAPGPMMTVECPQCGSHIKLPEGSHQITCPYCGLSGTL